MQHLIILPILLPLLTGVLLLLPPLHGFRLRQRLVSTGSALLLLVVGSLLLVISDQEPARFYALGNWQPPMGIVLVHDRLSSLVLVLTAFLAFASLLYACAGDDEDGAYFHPLFQFQLMGINGAFLTGDLFNLFVFFEVLLMASYALLIHGNGKARTRASLHYVILNLVGSALFLFALGILYGSLGSLNMADMALKIQQLPANKAPLVAVGGLMLLVVFGLKSALLPLQFWLPRTYAAAAAPVAALFAIMTKVGVYAILRVFGLLFGEHAGPLAGLGMDWLWPLALLTIAVGAVGVLASQDLRHLTAQLVLVSVGTLLAALALQRHAATSALLYYLVHSTLITAALFLLADVIARQRGRACDRLIASRRMPQGTLLGSLFFIATMAVVGLPPLSGFVGKLLLLQSAHSPNEMLSYWPLVLVAGLCSLIALTRAGSTLFWRGSGEPMPSAETLFPTQLIAIGLLLLAMPLLAVLGGPVSAFTQATATQLHATDHQIRALLPAAGGAP